MASSHMLYGESLHTTSSSQSPILISESSSTLRERRKKQQQPRQLLSCTKCRERKVKCDRTKPCSACCARGLPKECHFVLGEGTEFGPIQQSLELRKLRSENQRLKERLLTAKVSLSDGSDDEDESAGRPGQPSRFAARRQKRFRSGDHTDSLYFGSPGLASVISDFASMQVEPRSLAFTMPRGADLYAGHNSMYPFPALWHATTATDGLLRCLEPREDLLKYIDTFASKAVGFAFPFLPENLSRKEVEHFLQDAHQNAVAYPDALALIFAGAALGIQLGGEDEDAKHREDRLRRGDVFLAAGMQALRASAFLSRPTLQSLQALLIIAPYLTNSGRFLDAWSMFGLIIRLAQSIGLHRNPKYLDPVPDLRECTVRSNTWWWMLHTDQLYSMTLGRPLGISGIGDCQPAEPLTTDPCVLRLGEFVDQLTILTRQILSSNQLTDAKIDLFTDRLISLWDTMPDTLQFHEGWADPENQLPEYPLCVAAAVHFCKIHSYIILLNRQRVENARATPECGSPSPRALLSAHSAQSFTEMPTYRTLSIPRGRPMVLKSSHSLLDAFIFFYKRVRVALTDWTVGQQAFNACLIILLDALETDENAGIGKVEEAYGIFVQLDKDRVHQLAGMAVARISEGLLRLRNALDGRMNVQASFDRERTDSDVNMMDPGHSMKSQTVPLQRVSAAGLMESRYYNESVMDSRGMFLLEDPGLQSRSVFSPATGPLPTPTMSVAPQSSSQPMAQAFSRAPSPKQFHIKREHFSSAPPLSDGLNMKQPLAHQPHSAPQTTMPVPLQAPSHRGSSYVPGLQPRPISRKDSVAGSISHVPSPVVVPNSPTGSLVGPYGPTSMPPPMQAPVASQVYAGPVIQQPSFGAPHNSQKPSLNDQDWQALRLQQLAQTQPRLPSQMFPPHQGGG